MAVNHSLVYTARGTGKGRQAPVTRIVLNWIDIFYSHHVFAESTIKRRYYSVLWTFSHFRNCPIAVSVVSPRAKKTPQMDSSFMKTSAYTNLFLLSSKEKTKAPHTPYPGCDWAHIMRMNSYLVEDILLYDSCFAKISSKSDEVCTSCLAVRLESRLHIRRLRTVLQWHASYACQHSIKCERDSYDTYKYATCFTPISPEFYSNLRDIYAVFAWLGICMFDLDWGSACLIRRHPLWIVGRKRLMLGCGNVKTNYTVCKNLLSLGRD